MTFLSAQIRLQFCPCWNLCFHIFYVPAFPVIKYSYVMLVILVYSFQFHSYRYNCSANGTKSFAMGIGCKPLVAVKACSMTTFIKCCPFTLFGYFFKADWTRTLFSSLCVVAIYFFILNSKLCCSPCMPLTNFDVNFE